MSMTIIPDISHHEKVTDWAKVKATTPFIIMRAMNGMTMDTYVKEVVNKCEKYKIPYWLYIFVKKGQEVAQTKNMVKVFQPIIGKYFVGYCLDIEKNNILANTKQALDWLSNQYPKTMIYVAREQYNQFSSLITNRPANCAWWEPRYGKNDGNYSTKYPPHKGVELHQYTEYGTFNGISPKKDVDLNRLTGERDLKWFSTPIKGVTQTANKPVSEAVEPVKKSYSGTYPVLPSRGYFVKGDGITALTNYPTQLTRMQKLINWIDDTTKDITIDGQFGAKTEEKVKVTQKILGLTATGRFDSATLKAAKAYKK